MPVSTCHWNSRADLRLPPCPTASALIDVNQCGQYFQRTSFEKTVALVHASDSLLRTILRAFAGLDRSNDATSEA
jgi:hypothetical protein